jgi:hypothetical protein
MGSEISRGNFTLPVETHWGKLVMAPGPYSYTLDRASVGFVISVRAQGKSGMIPIPITGDVSTGETSTSSSLQLVAKDGETSVSSIHFAHLGLTLRYHVR